MYDWMRRLFSTSPEKPEVTIEAPSEEIATPPETPISSTSWMQRDAVNAAFINWLFEGNENADLFVNQIEKDILAALEKIVKNRDSGASLVRRMPGLIPQLLNSLRTEHFSGKQLAEKISHDVVLVAAVIRLANSSLYNPSQPIKSIEHAVLVLGQGGLRQLITSVAFQPIIDLKSGRFTKLIAPRLWDQSEKCAVANRLLAVDERVDPFEAFLAGLIQNVGLMVSLRMLDQVPDGDQRIGSRNFCNALINHARTLSCSISREWRFPENVTNAIAEQGPNSKIANMSPIGKILLMGEYLSKMQILIGFHRLNAYDASLIRGLSDKEMNCLNALGKIDANE
jgi:HD-like signal output (HDOD) protein